jgi:CheY-like chemotaxis protein
MLLRESITVRVLLVSRHIHTIETLCQLMQPMAMHVETCCDLESAMRKLCRSKFEGLIVDFNDKEEALELLKKLRQTTSHRGAVSCAILNQADERGPAFQAGANFVLERPLSANLIARTLRAAYPLMLRERRRYFRCPVRIPTFVRKGSSPEFQALSVNISEAGIAINSPTTVQVGEKLQLRLQLPGKTKPMTLTGEVRWTDATGRVGLHFLGLANEPAQQLQAWLAERLEELAPEADSTQRVESQ